MPVDARVQRTYTAVLEHFIEHGRGPHYTELAGILGVPTDEARALLRAASEADRPSWLAADTEYIQAWAPFGNMPTQYHVSVDGRPNGYALCGLEALAIRWMFPGREVRVAARCLDCAEPLSLTMRDEEVSGEPSSIVFHSNNAWSAIMAGEVGLPFA